MDYIVYLHQQGFWLTTTSPINDIVPAFINDIVSPHYDDDVKNTPKNDGSNYILNTDQLKYTQISFVPSRPGKRED